MCTVRRRLLCGLFGIALANVVIAADVPFTGVFSGTGRACYGKLFIRTKTIEWHTSFASCKQTPYKIIKTKLNATKPEIVFLLKARQSCDFGVVALDWDPEYPDYWNATGYRSLGDYKKKSDDTLRCNLERLDK